MSARGLSRRLVLGGAFAVVASACLMTPAQRREDTLIREARQFNDDLRWARWDVMGGALPPEEARLFGERAAAFGDDLQMADCEVTQINFGQPSDQALVTVKIDWYTKRDQTVRSTTLEQRWEQHGGRWMMVKQRRTRGDRFPLVTEPASADPPGVAEEAPAPAGTGPEAPGAPAVKSGSTPAPR